jgi:hypothetical protein
MFLAPHPAAAYIVSLIDSCAFCRTPDDDVIDGATFDDLDHFANELFEYLIYFNNH